MNSGDFPDETPCRFEGGWCVAHSMEYHDRGEPECKHEDVELDLGYLGDPARENPSHGTCLDCGASVHEEGEQGEERPYRYWEAD